MNKIESTPEPSAEALAAKRLKEAVRRGLTGGHLINANLALSELFEDRKVLAIELTALRARLERAEGALRSLTDEAQILVNIIHCNTDTIGRCRLSYDMTIGTGKAIEAAHASMSSPSAKPGEKEEK